jgi:hypothetical protein
MPALTPISWSNALTARRVWARALTIGLPVGLLQICVNQGDIWLHGSVTRVVVIKTLLTPLIAIGVCLVSAASAYRLPHTEPLGSLPTTHGLPRS